SVVPVPAVPLGMNALRRAKNASLFRTAIAAIIRSSLTKRPKPPLEKILAGGNILKLPRMFGRRDHVIPGMKYLLSLRAFLDTDPYRFSLYSLTSAPSLSQSSIRCWLEL